MADDEQNLPNPNDSEVVKEIDIRERPGLVDICIAEIKYRASNALSLKEKIRSAKTAPKKKLYEKKLLKNSKRAAEILLYLEHIQVSNSIRKHEKEQQFIDIRNKEDDNGAETSNSNNAGRRSSKESNET